METEDKNSSGENLDPQVESVFNSLKEESEKKNTFTGNLSILIISVILFLASGLINNPIIDIAAIILIILIHELGHLLAMKAFGYKDVKMFFVPFFGAAVTGKHENVSSVKKTIISLAGPVPGIIIGILLMNLSFISNSNEIYNISLMFLFLNGLNLLPLYPFDGGKFMTEIFFNRNKYLEFSIKLLAIATFWFLALELNDIVFGLIGLTVMISMGASIKLASLAQELKDRGKITYQGKLLELNATTKNRIVNSLIKKFPNPHGKQYYNNLVTELWERLTYVPPKIISTIVLLLVYLYFLTISILNVLPQENTYVDYSPEHDTYFFDENFSDGISYHPNGAVHIISSWKDGKKDGVWSEYDVNKTLIAKYIFENDKFVYQIRFVDGRPDTIPIGKLNIGEEDFLYEYLN